MNDCCGKPGKPGLPVLGWCPCLQKGIQSGGEVTLPVDSTFWCAA